MNVFFSTMLIEPLMAYRDQRKRETGMEQAFLDEVIHELRRLNQVASESMCQGTPR